MIRAIIIDDEKKATTTLNKLIVDNCSNVEIVKIVDSADTAFTAINSYNPDLIFLDVEMPGKNGFDLLEMFDKINFDVVFTTAFGHYAIQAIKFSALDYLLKPIDVDELKEAICKVEQKKIDLQVYNESIKTLLSNLKSSDHKKVAIPDLVGMTFVNLNEIIRCQSDRNYTVIIIDGKNKIVSTKILKEYETLFSDHNFFRVHHSHLINLDHVKRYVKGKGGYVIMSDGSEVEISRRRKNEFLEKLSKL